MASAPDWNQFASEFDKAFVEGLAGGRIEPRRKQLVLGPAQAPGKSCMVVVVIATEPGPDEKAILRRIQSSTNERYDHCFAYYVVDNKHWAILRPEEFNPTDDHVGDSHKLQLMNLLPDYVLIPKGSTKPLWSGR